ncbi:hypothetical protein GCM10009795_026310 [Nocardioides hankookensis]|uniref:DUF3040 domain-containing protein n=1 Tax=Nocardioides hankookensis TaxID=443157 RepID=A0ABW1LDA4_9ACTN
MHPTNAPFDLGRLGSEHLDALRVLLNEPLRDSPATEQDASHRQDPERAPDMSWSQFAKALMLAAPRAAIVCALVLLLTVLAYLSALLGWACGVDLGLPWPPGLPGLVTVPATCRGAP